MMVLGLEGTYKERGNTAIGGKLNSDCVLEHHTHKNCAVLSTTQNERGKKISKGARCKNKKKFTYNPSKFQLSYNQNSKIYSPIQVTVPLWGTDEGK